MPQSSKIYCNSLTEYSRRESIEVKIGDLAMGAKNPIRVQSMTTIDTMDTLGSVEQVIRMVESGCEYVRITAPSVKEAQNLENIKKELRLRGYTVPLIADIHFTPNAAELAARIVEKVRINPGNYADKKRFETIDYTDASYQIELERIRERFLPLIKICKEYGTAMRIGTNHGSLSDRILSRYGDSPVGMVESALEFLRICEDENYFNIVLSMKSSNTQVMVQAYRLLVARLNEEGLKAYPLHLGVTEAGEGEDGRIKSALGIGTLLEDGLGDTVRVSLTEDPEFEAPVAKMLIDKYIPRVNTTSGIEKISKYPTNPFQYSRRITKEVANFGGTNVPRVIANFERKAIESTDDLKAIGHFYLPLPDKWAMNDLGADYIYTGNNPSPFMLPNGLKEILNYKTWIQNNDQINTIPLFELNEINESTVFHSKLNFIKIHSDTILSEKEVSYLKNAENIVIMTASYSMNIMQSLRCFFFKLHSQEINCPVVIEQSLFEENLNKSQIYAATDAGGLMIDGFGDGIMLEIQNNLNQQSIHDFRKLSNNTAFGILQAARCRMSKTEYISCPSCGRTLFDLQETTALIRKQTDHLKGIKIGIMGCIVNGPGEMADADYGYVGIGKDKIALYRGQNVVKKSVVASEAVSELINLIKEDNKWNEPEEVLV
jgi:(E)-4-hydroxy-3-methylbut-2-enyl-diphosphate synthase